MKYIRGINEAFIGPFVFSERMSDDELKGMYNAAIDGYSYHQKGMQYSKSDYKKAYMAIEKILKKRGVKVDEGRRIDEAIDMNDPVLIAFRASRRELPKFKPAKAKSRRLSFDKYMDLLDTRIDIDQQIKDLGDEMAQTLRDMKLKAKKDKIMARIDKHRMD